MTTFRNALHRHPHPIPDLLILEPKVLGDVHG